MITIGTTNARTTLTSTRKCYTYMFMQLIKMTKSLHVCTHTVILLLYLGDIDSGPEELEMFSHLGWLVLGVEYG